MTVMASASPSAKVIVVEVVGATASGPTSRQCGRTSGALAAAESMEPLLPVMAMIGIRPAGNDRSRTPARPSRRFAKSGSQHHLWRPYRDHRELLRRDAGRSAVVPVEANVAAIFRAIWPDLPRPLTISLPLQPRISSTARTNGSPRPSASASSARASSCNMSRPNSKIAGVFRRLPCRAP